MTTDNDSKELRCSSFLLASLALLALSLTACSGGFVDDETEKNNPTAAPPTIPTETALPTASPTPTDEPSPRISATPRPRSPFQKLDGAFFRELCAQSVANGVNDKCPITTRDDLAYDAQYISLLSGGEETGEVLLVDKDNPVFCGNDLTPKCAGALVFIHLDLFGPTPPDGFKVGQFDVQYVRDAASIAGIQYDIDNGFVRKMFMIPIAFEHFELVSNIGVGLTEYR